MASTREIATLAGGCFWCTEAVFERLEGVDRVVSGYTGGTVNSPTYEQVCDGTTGHAEAIQITFDPVVVSYRALLEMFFVFHDPTTLNRQGGDAGTQYRSAVYYSDPAQERVARELVADFEQRGVWPDRIVTEVTPIGTFYPAESYHQGYYRQHPERGYCRAVIEPKVSKLRSKYARRLKGAAAELSPVTRD